MQQENLVRLTLKLSFFFNLFASYLLVFPDNPLAQLAGFTPSGSVIHTALAALFVAALGFAYAWLARQPVICRPLLSFGAIIKTGAFTSFLILWLLGALNGRIVLFAIVDIVLAALWINWMRTPPPKAAAGEAGGA